MKRTAYIKQAIISVSLAILLLGVAMVTTSAGTRQASTPAPQKASKNKENIVNQINDEWTWRRSENGIVIEVKMRGKVEFNDDYSDVERLSDDGWVRITDNRARPARKLEIAPNADGSLKRAYWVDGEARPYNEESRRWLATVLIDAVRQGGFDARNRVKKILSRGGASGVLEEISLLQSDYVKGLYFGELLKSTTLDSASVQRALREVAQQMSSDYAKAQVLLAIAESYLDDQSTRSAYLDAVGTIGSNYERGRVLSALLKKSDLSNDTLAHTLRIASAISSDYEKAQLLMKMAEGKLKDNAVRRAYMETASSIGSSYERARVLLALLNRSDLDEDAILLVVKSATAISSDYEKARVLLQVAGTHSGDEQVRAALTDAAKTIGSSYERGRVLSATYK